MITLSTPVIKQNAVNTPVEQQPAVDVKQKQDVVKNVAPAVEPPSPEPVAKQKYDPDRDPVVDDVLGIKKKGKDPVSTEKSDSSIVDNIKSRILNPAEKCLSALEGYRLIENAAGAINDAIEPHGGDPYGLMNVVKGMERGFMAGNKIITKYYGNLMSKIVNDYLSNIYPAIPDDQKEHAYVKEANEMVDRFKFYNTATPLRFKKFKR